MTRHQFGQSPTDWTFTVGAANAATLAGGVTLSMWDLPTSGTQITDLLTGAGAAISVVTSSSGTDGLPIGTIPLFYGPDGITEMWADAGGGYRSRITAHDAYAASDDPRLDEVGGAAVTGVAAAGLYLRGASSSTAAWTADGATDWINVRSPAYGGGAAGDGTTDDTAALQAALAAVPANGGTVYLPAGSYRITATLTLSVTGTQLVGAGWGSRILFDGSVVATAIAATGNIRGHVRDLRISQSNASHLGTAIDASQLNGGVIERVLTDGSGTGAAPLTGITMNAPTCHYNTIRSCRINYGGAGSAGIKLAGGSHSNTVTDCRLVPAGDDTASSGVYIGATHSTTLIHPDVEQAAGNGIWLDTGAHGTTIVNPYLEANGVGLKLSAGVVATTVTGGTIQTSTTANVQDNGSVNSIVQNAWPNSGTTTYNRLELGNVDKASINGVPWPANSFQASDQGLLAWSYDAANASNSTAVPTGGVVHLVKVNLRYGATITNILYQLATAGAGLTSGQCFVGLYDSTGTLRGTSASQSTAWAATTGLYTTPLVTPYTAPAGTYWVAIVVNGTTGPALARGNGLAGAGGVNNAGLTPSTYRFATNGSGNASLPSTITPASNGQAAVPYWAAVS